MDRHLATEKEEDRDWSRQKQKHRNTHQKQHNFEYASERKQKETHQIRAPSKVKLILGICGPQWSNDSRKECEHRNTRPKVTQCQEEWSMSYSFSDRKS